LQTRRGQFLVALATVAAYAAYHHGWLGEFFDPSFLPGAGLYFAVGIATRLLFTRLPEFKAYPRVALAIGLGFCLLSHKLLPFVAWAGFVAWLRTAPADNVFARVFDAAFNSKTARYLGARSYSTYLIHEPIIYAVVFLCVKRFGLGQLPTLGVVLPVTIALSLVASVVLYRIVEAPSIAFGKRLFVGDGAGDAGQWPAQRVPS
jgi:peptidoglycan/LPS O-acetylase OafA/YrhL